MRASLSTLLLTLGFLALGLLPAAPAGAVCPGPDRTIGVDPGALEMTIFKAPLTWDLPGYVIVSTAPPSHGLWTEYSDRYTYRPRSSFWTAGVDTFEIRLGPNPNGRVARSEPVVLVPTLLRAQTLDEGLEGGPGSWTIGGAAGGVEVYTGAGVITGGHSLRLHADPAFAPGWIAAILDPNSGGQQGSGAQGTIRPPGGGGGGSGRSVENPSRVVVFELGAGTAAQHRLWLQDDGTVVSLLMEGLYGATPWIPVSRAAHHVRMTQWIGGGTGSSLAAAAKAPGAHLLVDGVLVGKLIATQPLVVNAGQVRASTSLVDGPPIEVELDDLQLFDLSLEPAVFGRLQEGFEGSALEPAWSVTSSTSLALDPAAALDGVGGLSATLGASFSGDFLAAPTVLAGNPRQAFRLRLDPNSVAIASGGRVTLLEARTAENKRSVALLLDHDDGVYHLRLQVDEDGSDVPRTSNPVTIPDGPVALTLSWRRSPSQYEPLGTARLWVDGLIGAELLRINSFAQQPVRLRLGAGQTAGASVGSVYLDSFMAAAANRY